MKKIINEPRQVVSQTLQGIVKANPKLTLFSQEQVIARRNHGCKVGIVSGGGSGHEPEVHQRLPQP